MTPVKKQVWDGAAIVNSWDEVRKQVSGQNLAQVWDEVRDPTLEEVRRKVREPVIDKVWEKL